MSTIANQDLERLLIHEAPQYSVGPSVSDNGDGTLTAVAGLSSSTLTSDEITTIITEQWPNTWVWSNAAVDYNYLIESASC